MNEWIIKAIDKAKMQTVYSEVLSMFRNVQKWEYQITFGWILRNS